jgi:hypothetical protein
MGLWDKLRPASDYLRKLRLSLGPESYFRYKRDRNLERKRAREHAAGSARQERADAERGREEIERERGYEERYTRERAGDGTQEETKRREELETDR